MIGIQRRPYNINLAGNSIVYQLYDAEAVNDTSYTFEVRVMFARYEEGQAPAEIAIIPLTPYKGLAFIDLNHLLNCQLDYFTPDPATGGAQVSGLHTGKFYIHYRRVTTANTNTAWNTSEEQNVCNVIKGGVHPYMWKGNNYFLNYFPANLPFLTWQQRGRLTAIAEPLWLTWLNDGLAGNLLLYVNIQVTYTDGSTASIQYNIPQPLKQYWVYYLPAGAQQLGLPALSVKTIWYWDVWVYDSNGQPFSEKYRYLLDQKNDYNQKFLLYRNSLGGLDTVRVRGVIETNITLDGADIERTAAADWAFAGILPRIDASTPHRELPNYKGDAGYVTREEQDRLRDMFFNREIYMYQGGRLLPVKLTSKQYRLRATSDKLFSLAIEWMLADAGSYYYTPGVSLGDGQNNFIDLNNVDLGDGQSSGVCPNTILLSIQEITYAGGNATIKFSYIVTGSAPKKLQYKIPGYITNWTDYPYNPSGIFNYTVQAGQSVTLYMRSVCDNDGYGQVASKTANTSADGGPSPNSTIRNYTGLSFDYTLTRNGQFITQGSLQPDEYDSFYISNANNATYVLTVVGIQPSSATLRIGSISHNGSVNGQTITWVGLSSGISVLPGISINVY